MARGATKVTSCTSVSGLGPSATIVPSSSAASVVPLAAVSDSGADVAYPSSELAERLPAVIGDTNDLYYSLGLDPALDSLLSRTIAELRMRERRGRRAPKRIVDPREILDRAADIADAILERFDSVALAA